MQSSGLLRQNICSWLFVPLLQCHFFKMMTLSVWIFGLLCTSLTGAHGLDYIPENFVVAKMNDNIKLICDTDFSGDVTWKFGNDLLKEDVSTYSVEQGGLNLNVIDVDTSMLGNYSCWKKEEMLSSTYLLLEVQDEEEDEEEDKNNFIKCRAKSYDCNFSCTWIREGYKAVRLGLGPDCREGKKSCHWVSNSNKTGGFQFELSHSLSPYDEESKMLELTAEAIDNNSNILRRTKKFYLRNIVQPDSPQIVRCQVVEQDLNVTIYPPSSWSTPHSFFSLEHEIEYMLKDDGKTQVSSSALIPKKISMLRVRSRDSVVLSNWSQWTPWKNVKTGKKLCKCKNTMKYCCPEFPSGHLDRCKKMRKKGRKVPSGVHNL